MTMEPPRNVPWLTHLRERHDATGPSPTPRNFLRTTASGKNILDVTTYGGFHSHGGTPGAGWFCHGKSETHMNDWTPPYEELKPKKMNLSFPSALRVQQPFGKIRCMSNVRSPQLVSWPCLPWSKHVLWAMVIPHY